jgi:transposase
MALVNAATLLAALGALSRLTDPRQLMSYLGLVPSEHSRGASVKRGSITKAGNSAARRLLIEAAWCYRFPARVSRELLLRQENQPKLRYRVEGASAIVRPLSQARSNRKASQRRHRCDRSGTDGLHLGHRPPRPDDRELTGAPA